MKKVKTILFLIIIIFLGLIIYQNRGYFFEPHPLVIDLKIGSWTWPSIVNIGYFVIFFGIGFIIAGYMGITSSLKARKVIKQLNRDLNEYYDKMISLKAELDKFNSDPYIDNAPVKTEDKPAEPEQST